jgi:hypothetical protein
MAEAVCRACLQPWDRYRRCGCEASGTTREVLPPQRLVCDEVDFETVDEDGPEAPGELGEEELPF